MMVLLRLAAAAALVAWWYGGSVLTNVAGKALFTHGFLFPLTAAWLGMATQLVTLTVVCVVRGGGKDRTPLASVARLAPASAAVVMGNVFHRYALMSTSIPMLHTVKSLSTVTTAVFAYVLTGQTWPSSTAIAMIILGVGLALMPGHVFDGIVESSGAGVVDAIARGLDAGVAGGGFTAADVYHQVKPLLPAFVAMLSESTRSVLAKAPLSTNTTANLLKLQCISLALLTPVIVVKEGPQLLAYIEGTAFENMPLSPLALSIAGAVAMETGNFISLSFLAPVTHAMANSIRSLVVVGAGVLFGAVVARNFWIGCALSVAGAMVHAYLAAAARAQAKAKQS